MNARMYADQILERSRDMMTMQDHRPRVEIRAALLDITVSVAKQVADRYCAVADQQNRVMLTRGGKVLRDMRTLWRAVIRNVKKVYDTHPIMERHLFCVVAAYHTSHVQSYPKLLDHQLMGQQIYRLMAAGKDGAAHVIKSVLEEGYSVS